MALTKSQCPSSCSSRFLLSQSLQISLGVLMMVPAVFPYNPPNPPPQFLHSSFSDGISSLKTSWHSSLFLFHKTNHSFILLHYLHFLNFVRNLPFFFFFFPPLVSLAILILLFGFRSSAPFLNAGVLRDFVLMCTARGGSYFFTWINFVSAGLNLAHGHIVHLRHILLFWFLRNAKIWSVPGTVRSLVLSGWKSFPPDGSMMTFLILQV